MQKTKNKIKFMLQLLLSVFLLYTANVIRTDADGKERGKDT